ncbi:MAG: hypothetical protein ACI30N_06710, partial [Muribaculaceae bacterium]
FYRDAHRDFSFITELKVNCTGTSRNYFCLRKHNQNLTGGAAHPGNHPDIFYHGIVYKRPDGRAVHPPCICNALWNAVSGQTPSVKGGIA